MDFDFAERFEIVNDEVNKVSIWVKSQLFNARNNTYYTSAGLANSKYVGVFNCTDNFNER